jgi:hypothetical protein
MFGCSYKVPASRVYGTYVASYPFGADTLTLNQDGSFVQTVAIRGKQQQTLKGQWSFDPSLSYAKFNRLLIVDDGNGHLNNDWQIPSPTLVDMDVEMHWFKIVMESAAAHPYVKQ